MPFHSLSNANIYYELHGNGSPLVLISGYSCDHQTWLPILDELCRHFQVLIFDNRGSGQTTDDGQALTVELLAQDAIELIRALGLQTPTIMGHSMGGSIAQCIASSIPDEIKQVILLNTSSKWRKAVLMGLRSHILMREKNVDLNTILTAVLPWLFGEKFLSNDKGVRMFKQASIDNPYMQSIADQRRQIECLEGFNGLPYLANIKAPTLIVAGEEDIAALPEESAILASYIPQARTTLLNCGHGVMFEVPRDLVSAILEFNNE